MESTGLMRSGRFNPAGVRILVVDNNPTCLKALGNMLTKCNYQVTTCNLAQEALGLLETREYGFDMVLSDVKVGGMDGFMFTEQVCLKMDLPVIMMSEVGDASWVMKGVQHGASDYLVKPIKAKDVRNIWQHVYRKRLLESSGIEGRESLDQTLISVSGIDSSDDSSTFSGDLVTGKKRKDDVDDPASLKKPRVVWTKDLHLKFVAAVNRIGLDKVGPKKILELMEVPGLSRENVASHLQKYRLYLSRGKKENDPRAACDGMKLSDISSSENTCPQSGVSPNPNSLTLQQNIVMINENFVAPRHQLHIHSHRASICEGNVPGIMPLPMQGEVEKAMQGEVEKAMFVDVPADAPTSSSSIIAYNQQQQSSSSRIAYNQQPQSSSSRIAYNQQQQQQPLEMLDLEVKSESKIAHYAWNGGGAPPHQQFKQHIRPHFQFDHYPLVSHSHGPLRRQADQPPTQANINHVYSKSRSYAIGTENTDTAALVSIPQQSPLTNCHTFEQVPCSVWTTKSHDVGQQSHLHNNLESSATNMIVGTGSALRLHDMEVNAYAPAGGEMYLPNPHLVNINSFGCSSNQEELVSDARPEFYDPNNFEDEYGSSSNIMDYFSH